MTYILQPFTNPASWDLSSSSKAHIHKDFRGMMRWVMLAIVVFLFHASAQSLRAENSLRYSWEIVNQPTISATTSESVQIVKFGVPEKHSVTASVSPMASGTILEYATKPPAGTVVSGTIPFDPKPEDLEKTQWTWTVTGINPVPSEDGSTPEISGNCVGKTGTADFSVFADPMQTGTVTFVATVTGIVGEKAGEDHQDLTYTCSGTTTMKLPTVGITIKTSLNNAPEPGQPIQSGTYVAVGEPIALQLRETLSSCGLPVTNQFWHVDHGIQGYNELAPANPLIPLKPESKRAVTLELYFPVVADSGPVSCTFKAGRGGEVITVNGIVKLVEPIGGEVKATQTKTLIGEGVRDLRSTRVYPGWGIACGSLIFDKNGQVGFAVQSESLYPPEGFSTLGKSCWAQILSYDYVYLQKDEENGVLSTTKLSSNSLDNSFPYCKEFDVNDTDDSPNSGGYFNPGEPFTYTTIFFGRTFGATMYRMWKSDVPNSIWVPLKQVEWYWLGRAIWEPNLKKFMPGHMYSTEDIMLLESVPASEPNWSETYKNTL